MDSWWLDNQIHQLQRDGGEETTPNHTDVGDRVNQQLRLRVGDVVWCARRPALPEVSEPYPWESFGFIREFVVLRHPLVLFVSSAITRFNPTFPC